MSCVLSLSCVFVALDIAVSLMEVGEVAEVKAAPRFLYGELGR